MKLSAALLMVLVLAGCDNATTPVTPIATGVGSTTGQTLSASIATPILVGTGCAASTFFTSNFSVVVVSSTNIDLNSGTIRLIDGSGVGGPTIPIPQSALSNGTSSSVVSPGSPTTLILNPNLPCPTTLPASVVITMNGVDANGATHAATVAGVVKP